MQHEKYIRRRVDTSLNSPLHIVKPFPSLVPKRHQKMAKHPSQYGVVFESPVTEPQKDRNRTGL